MPEFLHATTFKWRDEFEKLSIKTISYVNSCQRVDSVSKPAETVQKEAMKVCAYNLILGGALAQLVRAEDS